MESVEFKLLSLNVRVIRSPTKRKALFIRLNKLNYDIIFPQETYSTVEVEKIWRTQWKGKLFFSHSVNHSCGVMALVRSDLEFEPKRVNADSQGCKISLDAVVQGTKYLFANVYAPNKVQQQILFCRNLNKNLENYADHLE